MDDLQYTIFYYINVSCILLHYILHYYIIYKLINLLEKKKREDIIITLPNHYR